MGPRSENRGYHLTSCSGCAPQIRFNGSTVREPWLSECQRRRPRQGEASMGPRSENRGYPDIADREYADEMASMGPRSENRGYPTKQVRTLTYTAELQWVHGPRTVVMCLGLFDVIVRALLQWVHGPRTVVMKPQSSLVVHSREASMGPRSENRGYVMSDWTEFVDRWLQWVHGPRTVVICHTWHDAVTVCQLQWVHGPRTVVMGWWFPGVPAWTGFNGSTVREPWLSCSIIK